MYNACNRDLLHFEVNIVDKSEYRAKLDQMTALVNAGDYQNAQTIADEIDWRRVKTARTLCMVSEIYEETDRLSDSRKVLEIAYKRALVKTVAYRLVEICLKLKDVDAAQDYYDDFADLAPMDNSKYILKYKIYRAKGDDLTKQIKALEDYKEREYTEPWAYELAKLYSESGNTNACVDACDDLILWFSEGPYVLKAMELKKKYVPLSPSQQEKYKKELEIKDVKATIPSFLKQVSKEDGTASDLSKNSDTKRTPSKIESSRIEFMETKSEDLESDRNISIRTEEFIGKMEEAAISTVQAESSIKIPFGKKAVGIQKPALDPARMQSQLADSIRNVFASLNHRGSVSEEQQDVEQEELFKESYQEDMSGYEIKDLEPENTVREQMLAEDVVLSVMSAEHKDAEETNLKTMENEHRSNTEAMDSDQIDGQMSFEDYAKKESEFDFEALFAETTSVLAKELASGVFEQETVVNSVEEADKIIEEEIARIVAEETKTIDSKEIEISETESEKETVEELPETSDEAVLEEPEEAGEDCLSLDIPVVEIEDAPSIVEQKEQNDSLEEIVTQINVNQYAQSIEEQHLANELEAVFLSEDTESANLAKHQDKEETVELESITISLEEETADELEKKIIAEVQKEPVVLTSAYENIFVKEELITDPELVVLKTESPKELTYLPLEPRALTEEEKEIFTYFSRIPGLGEQITVALNDVHNHAGDKTSRGGNFLVIGRQGSGKTRLYESMVLAICKDLGMDAAKNAKILARDFNHKDPASVVAKLAGGFLAIEGAGELSDEAAEKLSQAMEFRTDSLVVVLEDEKDDLMQLLERHPRLAEKFTSTIKIPVFTNDELVAFARIYALDQGYRMDEMGVLALYTKIGDNQKDAEPITVGKVKEMLDEAMTKANKGHRKLSRRFSKNAVDEENRIILFEKDFE